MTTPGVLARRKDGAWVQDGSYILSVPNVTALPVAPTNDDVFAFVHDTAKLMRSLSGAWVEFSSGGAAALVERAWSTEAQNIPDSVETKVYLGAQSSGGHFDLTNDRWVCPVSGWYTLVGTVGFNIGVASARSFGTLWVNGAVVVRGTDSIGALSNVVVDVRYLTANDTVALGVWQTGGGTIGIQLDPVVTHLVVSAAGGPKGDKGDPGTATAGYFAAPLGPLTFGTTVVEVPIGAVTLSSGFSKSGTTRLQCTRAGVYHVAAALSCTAGTGAWVIATVRQYRGANVVSSFDHVGGFAASVYALSTAVGEFDLAVNDQIAVIVQSSISNVGLDQRSTLAVSSAGGPKGDPGSLGTAKLDDLTDVTIATGTAVDGQALVYNGASGQWRNALPGYPVVAAGEIAGDLGSFNTGGVRDVCASAFAVPFTYPVRVVAQGTVVFGFGAGSYADVQAILVRNVDGQWAHSIDKIRATSALWVSAAMFGSWAVPANGDPNWKLICNGLDFAGQNCYIRGKGTYTVYRTG